jgi:hypothetical protein
LTAKGPRDARLFCVLASPELVAGSACCIRIYALKHTKTLAQQAQPAHFFAMQCSFSFVITAGIKAASVLGVPQREP